MHGKTSEKCDRHLVKLLERHKERNLTLNKDQCKIGMNQIVFIEPLLSEHGVGPKEEKVRAVRQTEPLLVLLS